VLYKSLLISQKFIKNILDNFINNQSVYNNVFDYGAIFYNNYEVDSQNFVQNMVQIINYNLNL